MLRAIALSSVLLVVACTAFKAEAVAPIRDREDTRRCLTALAWAFSVHSHYQTSSQTKGSADAIRPSLGSFGPRVQDIIGKYCGDVIDLDTLGEFDPVPESKGSPVFPVYPTPDR